jgi:hypothetical protein
MDQLGSKVELVQLAKTVKSGSKVELVQLVI